MSDSPLPWVILVAGNPSLRASHSSAPTTIDEPQVLLRRARVLTSASKTCCLLEDAFKATWLSVTRKLWPSNVFALLPGETVLEGVLNSLAAIREREPLATVILVPFNHCAVEEVSWLASANSALRLGALNRNTVYLLHDNPDNDPRTATIKPQVCSSSVMIGAAAALMTLCLGKNPTSIVDLVAGEPQAAQQAPFTQAAAAADAPLNVVHIRLAEEYATLQRGDVWHRAERTVDLHA